VYKEFVLKLGQDYSVLLPDTLPFIAELLEDSDPLVEEKTHEIVKAIENITGESMDQYL
jgi:U3 small nucleolar RNA-associated protein 10